MRTVVDPLPDDSIGDQRDAIAVLAAGNTLIAGCLIGVLGLQVSLLCPSSVRWIIGGCRYGVKTALHYIVHPYLSGHTRYRPFLAACYFAVSFSCSAKTKYGSEIDFHLSSPPYPSV